MFKTDCKVTRSLFESSIRYEADSVCLEVGIHKSIQITNKLKNHSIMVDRKEIAPGGTYMLPSNQKAVVVSFPPDMYMNQVGEELMDLADPVYGLVKVRYYLTIDKGART